MNTLDRKKQRHRVNTARDAPKPPRPRGSYCHERREREIEPIPRDAIYVSTYYYNKITYVIAMKHGHSPHKVYGELVDSKSDCPAGGEFIRVKLGYHGVRGDSGKEVIVKRVDSSIERKVLGNFIG